MVLAYAARSQVKTSVRIGTASLRYGIWSASYSSLNAYKVRLYLLHQIGATAASSAFMRSVCIWRDERLFLGEGSLEACPEALTYGVGNFLGSARPPAYELLIGVDRVVTCDGKGDAHGQNSPLRPKAHSGRKTTVSP